jgi:hypothetical protein
MSNSDNIKQTNDEETLQSAESTLDAQITLCVGTAETAFKHMQHWPNVTALAGLDRVIDLFQSFVADAQRLKDSGRPATYVRLTDILIDSRAARATCAKTLGALVAADHSDVTKLANHQSAVSKQQKELNDERLKQGQSQAAEIRKLL